jgi:hypothetical protein
MGLHRRIGALNYGRPTLHDQFPELRSAAIFTYAWMPLPTLAEREDVTAALPRSDPPIKTSFFGRNAVSLARMEQEINASSDFQEDLF